jgi:hypothetical protein
MTLRPLTKIPEPHDRVLVLLGGGSREPTLAEVVAVHPAGSGDPADDRVTLAPAVEDGEPPRPEISRSWLTLFHPNTDED